MAKLTADKILYNRMDRLFLLSKAGRFAVANRMLGIQAQFASNPKVSLAIRAKDFSLDGWQDGFVKTWAQRHTLHLLPEPDLGFYLSVRGIPGPYEAYWDLSAEEVSHYAGRISELVAEGISGRSQLKERLRNEGVPPEKLAQAFYGWGGVPYEMARRGRLAYDPGTQKRFVALSGVEGMDTVFARGMAIARYFAGFGPATMEDCVTYLGLRKSEFREAMDAYPPELNSAACDGQAFYWSGRLKSGAPPAACFLAGFDPYILGYRDRRMFTRPEDKLKSVLATGIVMPAVLLCGQVRGIWKGDKTGIVVRMFEPFSKQEIDAVAGKAEMFPAGLFGEGLRFESYA